jgi:outer membrane protein assembly factor BamB
VDWVRTTISCRFFAQLLGCLALTLTVGAAETSREEPSHLFPSFPTWKLALSAAPVAPPVIDDERLFIALQSGAVLARGLTDGRALWNAPLLATGPIAVADGIVVVPVADGIRGLAAATGVPLWSVPGVELNAPVLLRGGWLIVATGDQLAAFRAVDGTAVWSRRIGRVEQHPAIEGGALYAPMADGRLLALDLEAGSLVWERAVGSEPTEPFALDGRVYVGANGRDFVCVRSDNGEEAWRFQIGAAVRGAAAADALHVYVVSMDNLLRALHRTNGAVRWKQDLRYRPLSGPLLLGRHVVAGGMTRVLRGFDARTGAPAGELKFQDDAVTAPAGMMAAGERRAMLALATGNLRNEWTLIVATEPSPSLSVAPLTALPGTLLPLPGHWP